MSTFGSPHLQGAICIVVGCYGCCGKYSHKTSAGLMGSQSRPWAGLTHSAACWGKALNVSFYSFSSPAFSLNSLQLSLIPPDSMWMMIWTLIHADVLEIAFNSMCLGRKRSKKKATCAQCQASGLRRTCREEESTTEKPILVPVPPHSQGCRMALH